MGNTLQTPPVSASVNTSEVEAQSEVALAAIAIEEKDAYFTCQICYEEMSSIKEFRKGSDDGNAAAHPCFCVDCIAKHIQVQVEDRVGHIKCPAPNCSDALDPLECRNLIAASTFNKWCDNLRDAYLLGQERCYCPYRECAELTVNECGGNVTVSKCPKCKRLFCFKCATPWHTGYTCEASRHMKDPNDVLLEGIMASRGWKRCPKCGHGVERRYGCFTMRCRCRTVFCHNCGKEKCSCSSISYDGVRPTDFVVFVIFFVSLALLCPFVKVVVDIHSHRTGN